MQEHEKVESERSKWSDIEESGGALLGLTRVLGEYPAGLPLLALVLAPWLWGVDRDNPLLFAIVALIAVIAVADILRRHGASARSRKEESSAHTRDESENSR
jgi:hypothetical protein